MTEYENWVGVDDDGDVAEALAETRAFEPYGDRTFHASGFEVSVRDGSVEYEVRPGYDREAVEEFADAISESQDVQEEFVDEIVQGIEEEIDDVRADGGVPEIADPSGPGGYMEVEEQEPDYSWNPPA